MINEPSLLYHFSVCGIFWYRYMLESHGEMNNLKHEEVVTGESCLYCFYEASNYG